MIALLLLGCPDPGPAPGTAGTADTCVALTRYAADADDDGYGDPDTVLLTCDPPEGYVADESDCDDADPARYPGAPDVCATPARENCSAEEEMPTAEITGSPTPVYLPTDPTSGWGDSVLRDAEGRVYLTDPRWWSQTDGYGRIVVLTPDYTLERTVLGRSVDASPELGFAIADILEDPGEEMVVGDPAPEDVNEGAVYLVPQGATAVDEGIRLQDSAQVGFGVQVDAGADVDGNGRVDLLVDSYRDLLLYSDAALASRPAVFETSFLSRGHPRLVEDLDGDGIGELVSGFDTNGDGGLAVIFGPVLSGGELPTDADLTLTDDSNSGLGREARAVGDLDGDGLTDLGVGAPDAFGGAGAIFLVPGGPRGPHTADEFPFVAGFFGSGLGASFAPTRWGSDGQDLAIRINLLDGTTGVFVVTCIAGRTDILDVEDGLVDRTAGAWTVGSDGGPLLLVGASGDQGLYAIEGP